MGSGPLNFRGSCWNRRREWRGRSLGESEDPLSEATILTHLPREISGSSSSSSSYHLSKRAGLFAETVSPRSGELQFANPRSCRRRTLSRGSGGRPHTLTALTAALPAAGRLRCGVWVGELEFAAPWAECRHDGQLICKRWYQRLPKAQLRETLRKRKKCLLAVTPRATIDKPRIPPTTPIQPKSRNGNHGNHGLHGLHG